MSDTSPEANRAIFERTMSLTGEQRFLMGVSMFESARKIILASLPADLDEAGRKRRLFERTYGMTIEAALAQTAA